MLTIAYVISTRREDLDYQVPGVVELPCADCGLMLAAAPSTVGLLWRHPAAILLCASCALRRGIAARYQRGVTTSQARELQIYFRRN
ncbi:hypothetical protein ES708_34265 [subsurface metagenome]